MLLVTGASGFLGRYVALEALSSGRAVFGTVHTSLPSRSGIPAAQVDLTAPSAAQELVGRVEPAWVVNCVAFTNVDESERAPDRARLLNVEVPRTLAAACRHAGAGFVHISTDSVFPGDRGSYTEQDEPAPVNAYARSKLEGERAVRDAFPEALVLRTNFIGASASGKNGLADWIASNLEAGNRIDGFDDVVFSPLLAGVLARIILDAMDRGLEGLYHASAADACSKYDLARGLGAALGLDTGLVNRAHLADARMNARRPMNTSLSPSRLAAALERPMPTVESAISGYAAARLEGRVGSPIEQSS